MSDTPQEPKVARHGDAYVSLLDGNMFIQVGAKTMFDLTADEGHDVRLALARVLDPTPGPSHYMAVEVVAERMHRIAVRWGAESRSRTWEGLDEEGRSYWRTEARELLADAAAHGTW